LTNKIRVYELAKLLGLSTKELLAILEERGVEVSTHMSSIDMDVAQEVEKLFSEDASAGAEQDSSDEKKPKKVSEESSGEVLCEIPQGASISQVADVLNISAADAVRALVNRGMMVPANASADDTILEILGDTFGALLVWESPEKVSKKEAGETPKPVKKVFHGSNLQPRWPIVTVMGHVDHGKTTLLDYIRQTNVTAGEAGGITQHIGASCMEHNGGKVVFLDTPGHEAFTAMRARGAKVTDIAVLVVAADDGLMPQTLEAINHAKAANVPIIVAVNKMDKPEARPDRVRQQLSEHGLIPEEWGGDTIMVDVSAKTGTGVDQLLEMISLVAEMGELKADSTVEPRGYVIEAELDKGKGPVATVIVQEGTLMRGDIVLTESSWGRVRAMLDDKGKIVDAAGPSMPVEILGLGSVPQPGEEFRRVDHEKEARDVISQKEHADREARAATTKRPTLEDLYDQLKDGEVPQLNLVLKCDVQGSLEALKGSLSKLPNDEVGLNVVHEGVGRITESDVMLAAASDAIIIGFNVRPESKAKKSADYEGVQIRLYRVIYDIIDDVRAALEGMLAPKLREHVTGEVEIRAVFKVPKFGKVAGCYVTRGNIKRNSKVRLIRDGVVYWEGTLSDLKRFKDDVKEVTQGYECGMSFTNFQDFKEQDMVEAYEIIEEKRNLE